MKIVAADVFSKTIALEQMLWFVAQDDPSKDDEPDVDHFGEF